MKSFHLTFDIPEFPTKMEHGKQILFLGSCFSDEIAAKATFEGFQVDSNPLGTIFHPLAISRFLRETISDSKMEERIINRNDIFLTWDGSATVYGLSEIKLKNLLNHLREEWLIKLKSADFLFVTFGTAFGYRLVDTNELVANCHKFPSNIFKKVLTEQDEIVEEWEVVISELQKLNPHLKIIFTVSPVRHSKDGTVENNRSKAVLLDSIRKLEQTGYCYYFPSYEIVIDELRDYRFYKSDRVHPNEEAIQYVWERFSDTFFSQQTKALSKEVIKLKVAETHKSLFPESDEYQKHIEKTVELRKALLDKFPYLILD